MNPAPPVTRVLMINCPLLDTIRLYEIDVRYLILAQPEQVTIDLVHPAIFAALFNIELVPDEAKIQPTFLPFPNLLERLVHDVAVLEALVEQIGAAPVKRAIGHHVSPHERRGVALG